MWQQEKDESSIAIEVNDAKHRLKEKWGRKQKKSSSVAWPDEQHATEAV